MKIDERNWKKIRKFFNKTFQTTGHFSFATSGKDGMPHVTPIGSLFLTDCGKGYFFEEYTSKMVKNFKENDRVCIMAVNGSKKGFILTLVKGKASEPLSIRLTGRVSDKRKATDKEQARFLKMVRIFKWTRGYKLIWKNLRFVRDIHFDTYQLAKVGALTSGQEII